MKGREGDFKSLESRTSRMCVQSVMGLSRPAPPKGALLAAHVYSLGCSGLCEVFAKTMIASLLELKGLKNLMRHPV